MTSTLTVSALVIGLSLITQQSLEFEVASIKRKYQWRRRGRDAENA